MVSCQPVSVKNKVAIRAFNCWYFGNYVLSFFFLMQFSTSSPAELAVGKT